MATCERTGCTREATEHTYADGDKRYPVHVCEECADREAGVILCPDCRARVHTSRGGAYPGVCTCDERTCACYLPRSGTPSTTPESGGDA